MACEECFRLDQTYQVYYTLAVQLSSGSGPLRLKWLPRGSQLWGTKGGRGKLRLPCKSFKGVEGFRYSCDLGFVFLPLKLRFHPQSIIVVGHNNSSGNWNEI